MSARPGRTEIVRPSGRLVAGVAPPGRGQLRAAGRAHRRLSSSPVSGCPAAWAAVLRQPFAGVTAGRLVDLDEPFTEVRHRSAARLPTNADVRLGGRDPDVGGQYFNRDKPQYYTTVARPVPTSGHSMPDPLRRADPLRLCPAPAAEADRIERPCPLAWRCDGGAWRTRDWSCSTSRHAPALSDFRVLVRDNPVIAEGGAWPARSCPDRGVLMSARSIRGPVPDPSSLGFRRSTLTARFPCA